MTGRRVGRWVIGASSCALLTVIVVSGCQQFNGIGNRTPATGIPERVVVWADPTNAESTGSSIRDANNDEDRFIVVGTNGAVQFLPGQTVCDDCSVDIDNAVIDLGDGNSVDIRFGIGAVGDDTARRPFMVDAASGNFIQLVGGGSSPITFQVTEQPFEDPDDDSDDRAVSAGDASNGTATTGSGASQSGLCGVFGVLPVWAMVLVPAFFWRRR